MPIAVLLLGLLFGTALGAQEPALPAGLEQLESESEREQREEPGLPAGLGSGSEPALPSGLSGARMEAPATPAERGMVGRHRLNGFLELRLGQRLQEDAAQEDRSIEEARLQLQWQHDWRETSLNLVADLIADGIAEDRAIDLETGQGWFDLREANLLLRPLTRLDIKAGRQILTWGTGDLLFINDLFPKDWNAFFIGRDDEYLKAPSDAVKLSWFTSLASLDLVYTPRFDSDRYIDGSRISFFDAASGGSIGRDHGMAVRKPEQAFSEDEIALRLYRNLGSAEWALYAYEGYWKSPAGQDAGTGVSIFPRLRVLGASVRAPVFGGIGHLELGDYASLDDRRGGDPWIRNGEFRLLAGYERELRPNLSAALQWYFERQQDYQAYRATLPSGIPRQDRNRQLLTLRLTRLLMNQNLTLSLFNFYSPSDRDGYTRLRANYKLSDTLQVEGGVNLFYGQRHWSFFGQFEDSTNLYTALRYSF